jgi:hypothetical protein
VNAMLMIQRFSIITLLFIFSVCFVCVYIWYLIIIIPWWHDQQKLQRRLPASSFYNFSHIPSDLGCDALPCLEILRVACKCLVLASGHGLARVQFRKSVLPAVVRLAVVAMTDDHGNAAGAPLARAHSLLSTAAEAKHKVQGRLFLDVVVGECAAVLELLAGKDEALLVRGDALLVLQEKEAKWNQ